VPLDLLTKLIRFPSLCYDFLNKFQSDCVTVRYSPSLTNLSNQIQKKNTQLSVLWSRHQSATFYQAHADLNLISSLYMEEQNSNSFNFLVWQFEQSLKRLFVWTYSLWFWSVSLSLCCTERYICKDTHRDLTDQDVFVYFLFCIVYWHY